MHYSGLTYRPPFEANTLLLQVTTGCSHNACAFCTMYRNERFAVSPMSEIEEDLRETAAETPYVTRVFLENGDPFALPAARLLEISERIHEYLPCVETIAMYASIKNIRSKTDEELAALRTAGVNDLNIGVESGLDSALAAMNKGYTAAQALHELKRLRSAGIDYGANVILGIAGSGHWEENARATAELLNETTPYLIFTGTLHSDMGCPLYDDLQSGAFVESSFGEYLDEEELLLSLLNLENCLVFGLHPSNVVRMQGYLSRDKDAMLQEVRRTRIGLSPILKHRPIRRGEGAIVLNPAGM